MKEASQLNVSLRGADRSWTRLSKTVLTFVLAPRAKTQEQCKVGPIIAFEQRKYIGMPPENIQKFEIEVIFFLK